jgi:hypothetical protein
MHSASSEQGTEKTDKKATEYIERSKIANTCRFPLRTMQSHGETVKLYWRAWNEVI